MSVIEKLSLISDTITKLMDFTLNDELVKPDFDEYLKSVSADGRNFQAKIIPYIFERRLTEEKKTIIRIFEEKTEGLSAEEKEILEGLKTSFSSVFEIRRVLSGGFEFYNLINEKMYKILSLVKMNNFRGITPGQYALSRIFKMHDEYYLLEIENVLSSINKEDVYKYAAAKIIENPEAAYMDNPEKEREIAELVKNFGVKFKECFKTDEIITSNLYADNLINMFNNYCEKGIMPDEAEIRENIKPVEHNRYFAVSDFNNSYANFMEKSMQGFSGHSYVYDIGIIYDKNLGLFVLPFFQTFCKIYEAEDYKTIQGYKDCVKHFLENDKIPADIIRAAANRHQNFISRTNEILEADYTLDELLKYYKIDSFDKKIYSSASVLYASKIFDETVKILSERETAAAAQSNTDFSKIGRNDKCPCGSGKKFKNCCMGKI